MSEPCPACGTWVCMNCGWQRHKANRIGVQVCPHCWCSTGRWLDVRHTNSYTARDHREEYESRVDISAFHE